MGNAMLFLHVLGAVGMGFYLVMPFLIGRATKLAGGGQGGLADGMITANRFAQYFLVLQLLTGGYLISKAEYSVLWMVLIVVLFLAIAAVGGIMAKPLKGIKAAIESGQSATANINKARTMSYIVWVLFILILVFMKYPMYR
ncbi:MULTISPECIES: hypothetical protein [unclassified Paenibacillus]|uniref:hypothetical protein n=1 Tax=unclassified Paenibacillus TaxID=185978 RepID=UPI002F4034F8